MGEEDAAFQLDKPADTAGEKGHTQRVNLVEAANDCIDATRRKLNQWIRSESWPGISTAEPEPGLQHRCICNGHKSSSYNSFAPLADWESICTVRGNAAKNKLIAARRATLGGHASHVVFVYPQATGQLKVECLDNT